MLTRFQRGLGLLRLFTAVMSLSCAVLGAVEPVAAAPSAYAAALALPLPSQSAASHAGHATAERRVRRGLVSKVVGHPQPSAAASQAAASPAPALALARAPRLYLRHCALLR